jgi:hypothetical protein
MLKDDGAGFIEKLKRYDMIRRTAVETGISDIPKVYQPFNYVHRKMLNIFMPDFKAMFGMWNGDEERIDTWVHEFTEINLVNLGYTHPVENWGTSSIAHLLAALTTGGGYTHNGKYYHVSGDVFAAVFFSKNLDDIKKLLLTVQPLED